MAKRHKPLMAKRHKPKKIKPERDEVREERISSSMPMARKSGPLRVLALR
ncbi:MAG: hypothetical protein ACLQU5_17930 [Isosphaeraceae bacterium]|jgi:hypothetical protein